MHRFTRVLQMNFETCMRGCFTNTINELLEQLTFAIKKVEESTGKSLRMTPEQILAQEEA